jgi:hypothetical protein
MDKMKKKIAKLLALAIDQAGKPEGELASRRAMELMEQWGISQGEIDPNQDGSQMHREVVEVGATGWMYQISASVGQLCGLYVAAGNGMAWLMGRKLDTEIAAYLIASLMNQCKKDCANWRRERKADYVPTSRVDTNVFKESWAAGLGEKIDQIIQMQKAQAAEAQTSTALTVVGRRSLAKHWAEDQWRFGSRGGRSRAYNLEGRAAGRQANVQGGVGGKHPRQLTR